MVEQIIGVFPLALLEQQVVVMALMVLVAAVAVVQQLLASMVETAEMQFQAVGVECLLQQAHKQTQGAMVVRDLLEVAVVMQIQQLALVMVVQAVME